MLDHATPTLSYVWRSPGKLLSIALNLAVVDRLSLAVQAASPAGLRRAPEVGGILLGRVRGNNGGKRIEIEDFELVDSEHAVGPSYLLSAADRQTIDRRIRHHRKAPHKWSVVGLFRSHTRKDFVITTEDACLMSECFPESPRVFLLIHAIADRPLQGGYSIWEGRNMREGTPCAEFPFNTAALLSGNYTVSESAASTRGARTTSVASPLAAIRSLRRYRTGISPRLRQIWQPAMRFFRTPPKQNVLQWIASIAVLVAVIAAGRYQGPDSGTAHVRQTAPTSTAVQIPSAPSSMPEAPAAAVLEPAVATAPVVVEEKPLPMPSPPESPVADAAPMTANRARRDSPAPGPRSDFGNHTPVESPDMEKTSPPAPVPTLPLLPDAPEITNTLAGHVDLSREPDVAKFEAPRIPDPLVTMSFEALRTSRKLPGKHRTETQYTAPTLVREAPITVPAELRQTIRRPLAINVKLYLDRSGKVEFAELLSNGTGGDRDLASIAVFTSRHCEFSPARLGDETVPAEVVLRYRFSPDTRHD